jgi:hypothetical protein
MTYEWHDIIGNVGVCVILLAYFQLQTGRLQSTAMSYSVLNAVGALLVLISLLVAFNISALLLETVWLVMSIYGIVVATRSKEANDDTAK